MLSLWYKIRHFLKGTLFYIQAHKMLKHISSNKDWFLICIFGMHCLNFVHLINTDAVLFSFYSFCCKWKSCSCRARWISLYFLSWRVRLAAFGQQFAAKLGTLTFSNINLFMCFFIFLVLLSSSYTKTPSHTTLISFCFVLLNLIFKTLKIFQSYFLYFQDLNSANGVFGKSVLWKIKFSLK